MSRTTPSGTIDDAAPGGGGPARRRHRELVLAGSGSVLVTALGLLFLGRPELNPFTSDNGVLATHLVGGPLLTGAMVVLGLLGALLAAATVDRTRRRAVTAATTGVGLLTVVTYGVLAQGSGTLSVFGYLVAMAVPVVLVVLGVQAFRAYPGARLPIVVVALAAGVGLFLIREALGTFLGGLGSGLVRERWGLIGTVLPLLAAVAWAAVLLGRAADTGRLRRATAWVTRHRVLFTVLAALGPLPYALVRLTWLTPWPAFGGPLAEMDLAIRIQGLLLGSAGWLGVVLTLGLVLPWGERLPRWFGRRAGRPVSPLAAIVPGGLVALMLCGAAVPMLLMMGWQGAVLFPAWFWGPALALAVWGYAGHRARVLERVGTGV